MVKFFVIYYIAINLIGVLTNIIDKVKAKLDHFRIPEKVLWVIAIVGGALGSYITMQVIRHKTHKKSFMIIFPILSLGQVAMFIYFFLQNYTY